MLGAIPQVYLRDRRPVPEPLLSIPTSRESTRLLLLILVVQDRADLPVIPDQLKFYLSQKDGGARAQRLNHGYLC